MRNTIRRDQLKRLVQAGKVIVAGSYHFDDMLGMSRDTAKGMPAAIAPEDWRDRKEGVCYMHNSDFSSSCGGAYLGEDGIIHLYVHGNSNYDLQLIDGAAIGPARKGPAKCKRPENVAMQQFLAANGIQATVRYARDGSMRGTWRLYNSAVAWSLELAAKLNALGFTDFDLKPLGQFSGNGGTFSVSVRGHDELLNQQPQPETQATA